MPKGEPQTITKYGARWGIVEDAVSIEMACIRRGGQWKMGNGTIAGAGLFFHYKELQKLLWPEDSHHRWSDLMLSEILANRITAIMGPKDSGKTRVALSKFGLTDYLCFPNETLVLISSTDIRGLELRVWGDLKTMYQRAKARYPWLAGHLLDSKHAIVTDNLKEDATRDLRRGICCIPCMSSGGSWLGLGKYVGIKQKRRRLLGDECFPVGTMVSTVDGEVPIEKITPGQYVHSAIGVRRVQAVRLRYADSLVNIKTKDGRQIRCTPEHPFFTQKGWIKACNLSQEHYMLSPHETLQIVLQNPNPSSKNLLRECLLSELEADAGMEKETWVVHGKVSCEQSKARRPESKANAGQESNERNRDATKGVSRIEENWVGAADAWREWHRAKQSRSRICKTLSKFGMELPNKDGNEAGERLSDLLQSRSCVSRSEISNRVGRTKPLQSFQAGKGHKENEILGGNWVDSVEVSEHLSNDVGFSVQVDRRSVVYNLQVEGHPSYVVNGLVVHNCQFMKPSYIESLANLNSGDFKGVFVGNPLGEGDPLDKLAEPKDGWGTEGDVSQTTVWDNKFIQGRTINLVGTDSPNFEHSQDPTPKYPWMINRHSIEAVVAFYGMDSLQYYSQCLGIRRPGLNARRVISKMMCKKFKALEPAVWLNTKQTRIYAIDAAYGGLGGDRCIGIRIDFGFDVTGKSIIKVFPYDLIPVSVKDDIRLPEDQIADWVKKKCEGDDIPATHVFFDATGRGSLGTSFARLWSAYVNPVEYGGRPTERPVSTSLKVRDLETGQMRLKLCNEHYSKFVTELWYSVRYVIEAGQMRELPEEVMDEGCRREWKMVKGDKIEIETKEDMKERQNISPDLFDALATAVEGARRLGFQIASLDTGKAAAVDEKWKDKLRERASNLIKSHALSYQ